jgi:tyrosinase
MWEVWIAKWGADRLPADSAWLDTEFQFFDSTGAVAGKRIRDILETPNLGYVYESTTQPRDTPGPDPLQELAAPPPAPRAAPELLGAATGIDFSRRTAVDVELAANDRVAAAVAGDESVAPRWFLRVEDVAGSAPKAPAYHVYVNLPDGASGAEHPELRAGTIASFGIPEASDPAAEHGGVGITDTFEITDVVATLVASADAQFDPRKVTVHVVPVGLKGELDDGGDVRAGRISVYAG